jgi:hypothetical protein
MTLIHLFVLELLLSYLCEGWFAPENTKYSDDCEILRLNASVLISSKTPLSYVLQNFGKPVIIDDAVSHWNALKLWSNKEYFSKKYGSIELPKEIIINRTLGRYIYPTNPIHYLLTYSLYRCCSRWP